MQKNLTIEEVAKWLGYKTANQFSRNRPKMVDDLGFPNPIPGIGRCMYSQMQLDAWIASLLPEAQRKALGQINGQINGQHSPNISNPDDVTDILEQRLKQRKIA